MRMVVIAVLVVLVIGIRLMGGSGAGSRADPVQFKRAALAIRDLVDMVAAAGTINPVISVQVGSQVSGQISTIAVDFNTEVRRGQVIANIDPAPFRAELLRARAALERAGAAEETSRASLESARAGGLSAIADVATARSTVEQARLALEERERYHRRAVQLFKEQLISDADMEKARINRDDARSKVIQAEAGVEAAQARQKASKANIRAAEATYNASRSDTRQRQSELELAQIRLDQTTIFSPVDGIVISRNVNAGQTVAANFQAPVLFVIAEDLKEMQINANVDEADIGKVRVGQDVSFLVDSYPGEVFRGKVNQIRLQPQVNQNVVTYDVVIRVPNHAMKLLPGMTANLSILVAHEKQTLAVPAAALTFDPRPHLEGRSAQETERLTENLYGADRIKLFYPGAGPEGPRVFVEDAPGKVRLVPVRRGVDDGRFVQVSGEGLREGVEVIVGLDLAGARTDTSIPFIPKFRPGGSRASPRR